MQTNRSREIDSNRNLAISKHPTWGTGSQEFYQNRSLNRKIVCISQNTGLHMFMNSISNKCVVKINSIL